MKRPQSFMTHTGAKGVKGKCDQLFSKIVRSRGRCQKCGATERLQCAHIVSRVYSKTRCDETNALCLCVRCHMHFTREPFEFVHFVYAEIGQRNYELLKEKALSTRGQKMDWGVVYAGLRERWAQIERAA